MNFLKKTFHFENRRKFLSYLRLDGYNMHPRLKVDEIPKKRWKMLMTMRDLRYWIIENMPYSKRAEVYRQEIFQINKEINYLQSKAALKAYFGWLLLFSVLIYNCPDYMSGSPSMNDRPLIQDQTGGSTVIHDGAVPKLGIDELNDILGIIA